MSAQQFYVLDTNTIIDLHFGNLLEKIFQLPCRFSVTDSLIDEFHNPPFRVLKEKEIKKYGEYRTQRLVLEAWDRMETPFGEINVGKRE